MTPMALLDTQSYHYSIPGIRYLCRVETDRDGSDGSSIVLARQSYDTEDLQAAVGKRLSESIARLRSRRTISADERSSWLLTRLQYLVAHAYGTVPFYHRLYQSVGFEPGDLKSLEDFSALPIVTKADLLAAAPGEVLSRLDFGDVFRSRTSGSSGSPLTVVYSTEQYIVSMCNYIWQTELALGHPIGPERWIYNLHHARWWLSSLSGQYRTFTLSDLPSIKSLRRHLKIMRPQVLISLSSLLASIAEAGIDLREFGIEVATTNSEQSTRAERDKLSKAVGVPVLDEYSSVELEQSAFECRYGRYHILDHSVHLEVSGRDSSGVGSMIGTNLHALNMPFIRYDQGDFGVMLQGERCSCGNHAPALTAIHGRRNASFKNASGRLIPAASLLGIVDEFLADAASGVTRYRLHQTGVDQLTLHFCREGTSSFSAERLAMVHSHLERLFGHRLQMECRRVDELPAAAGYKRQLLVSDLT
jgi:phenylacetate-CoA ligase